MLISRLYLREFLKLFAVTGLGLSLVLSTLELIKKISDFMQYNPTASDLAYYAVLTFPRFFLYLMPVAALLCSLYTIGHAARTREIVAVMAAGGRVKRLLLPFVAMGVALSLLGFFLEEVIVPASSTEAKEVKYRIMKTSLQTSLSRDGVIWLRAEDGALVKIDFYIEEEDSCKGMTVFRTGKGGLTGIVDAAEARYLAEQKTWVLRDTRIYDTESGRLTRAEEFRYSAIGSPSVLKEKVRKPYELGIFELRRYLSRLEAAGFKNLRLSVELHSKMSYPLINLLMVLLGVSIAARRNLSGLVATAIGLLVTLVYWFGFSMLISLGYAGILPPVAAAWFMPITFGALSVYLFTRIPE